ncbi:MAG: ribosome biogenesis GTPase YlqF, partial [Clostridia bacterium]|nr:ribosome biogenesis GTPase YlqF [Clostridia bacterium]
EVNILWKKFYNRQGIKCVFINSKTGHGLSELYKTIDEELKGKYERDKDKGLLKRAVKAMVVGIPNVGKSTFINKVVNKASAKTGDKPGVTRDKQWIKANSRIHFLDTPGILWPKFDNTEVGQNLAFTGAIKDEIMNIEELVCHLIGFLKFNYPEALKERYSIEDPDNEDYDLLLEITKNRNYYLTANNLDTLKMSKIFLDEFRGGKMGKISLEKPQ